MPVGLTHLTLINTLYVGELKKNKKAKKYIRYIADRRLSQLGLKPVYLIEENPLPWMDYILNGMEHVNFFENRVTEYTKAATTGTWDEAFAIHDIKIL